MQKKNKAIGFNIKNFTYQWVDSNRLRGKSNKDMYLRITFTDSSVKTLQPTGISEEKHNEAVA